MRPHFVKTLIALLIGATTSLPEAFSADGDDSYSVSGECLCDSDFSVRIPIDPVLIPVAGQKGSTYRHTSTGVIGESASASSAGSVEEIAEDVQWVVIDGQRYVRAREGIPGAGGEPGQRIVLDGSVYLRDDGNLNTSDLFREKQQGKPDGNESDGESGKQGEKSVPDKAARGRVSYKAAAWQAVERRPGCSLAKKRRQQGDSTTDRIAKTSTEAGKAGGTQKSIRV